MLSKILSFQMPAIKMQTSSNSVRNNILERSPKTDTVSFGRSKETEIPEATKKVLDTTSFKFTKNNGEIFEGTIKDYLKSSLICRRPFDEPSLIHCTDTKQTAEDIINNGLDWTKTGRMKCGPGTYFSVSQAASMEQGTGSIALEGTYIGDKNKFATFEPSFYTAIDGNPDILNAVSKVQDGNERNTINKYCHDFIMDEMGVDILYASSGRCVGAFVVLNDNTMKLSKYGW